MGGGGLASSIDTAKDMLVRTRLINQRIDELMELHKQVIGHRSQLETGPFTRNDRLRSDLLYRLEGIDRLIRSANHTEARGSLNAYDLAFKWSQPLLIRMLRVKDLSQEDGSDTLGRVDASLQEIENKIILEDYLGADDALKEMEALIEEHSADVEAVVSQSTLPTSDGIRRGDTVCGLCDAEIALGAIICPVCGYDLRSAISECGSCGRKVSEAFNNCPYCGAGTSRGRKI